MSGPHTCQTGNPTLLGFLCQEWILHWSSHGLLPLLQACQCRHQEPSHLRHGRIPPFLPFHPGPVYRRQNHSRPSGCRRGPHGCVAAHKHLPGRSHHQSSGHLRIMAVTRASLLSATSTPDAGSSKGAHAGTSKGGIACTADTGPPDCVESTAQAIGLYISITNSGPRAIPSYSPTTRLHRHPFSKGGGFASGNIACTAYESPCTRAHCPLHPLPGAGTGPTCTLHCRKASSRAGHLPDAHGQNN